MVILVSKKVLHKGRKSRLKIEQISYESIAYFNLAVFSKNLDNDAKQQEKNQIIC